MKSWYVIEVGRPVLQFDGSGDLTVRYFVGAAQEQVASLSSAGTVYWMATDEQGSVRDVVDNSGNLVDNIVYTTFGQIAYESNSSIPHWAGYAGEHLSAATSLIISGARWYDPSTGRWLSNDPSGFAGDDGNLSRYVGNNPTNASDPTGLTSTWNGGYYLGSAALEAAYRDAISWLNPGDEGLPIANGCLDGYAYWFNNNVPLGQKYTSMMAPNIQNTLGPGEGDKSHYRRQTGRRIGSGGNA